MTEQPAEGSTGGEAARSEDDDYDLLTYGEVAARLSELVTSEKAALAELRAAPQPDQRAIAALEQRIELLVISDARYKDHALTADAFMRKFGLTPRQR